MAPNKSDAVPLYPRKLPTNGNIILSSPLQPEKAEPPMIVTLSGIVTLVRLLQPENAYSLMRFTLLGIVNSSSNNPLRNKFLAQESGLADEFQNDISHHFARSVILTPVRPLQP